MENIYENQNSLNIHYGVVLEGSASTITQGRSGFGSETPQYTGWGH